MTVHRVTEITSTSKKGLEAAIQEGLRRAARTLKGISGLEVAGIKARVLKDRITEYRVTLKITWASE